MHLYVCVECVQLCDGRRQLAAHIEMPHKPEGDAATRDPVPRFARRSSCVYNMVVNKSAFTHTAQHKTYMQALLQQQQRPGRFERQRRRPHRRWRLLHFNSSAIGFVHNRTHARAHAQGVSSGVGQLHACTCHCHCEPLCSR